MKVAVLPFNVTEGTNAALGRQFSNLIAETVRTGADAEEIQSISYLAQIQEEGGTRAAHVNMGDAVLERQFLNPLFKEGGANLVMHGLLRQEGDQFTLKVRFESSESEEPLKEEEHAFSKAELFDEFPKLIRLLAEQSGIALPETLGTKIDVGTQDPEAFLSFMEGYDGFQYIQQTNGAVSKEFQPLLAMQSLLKAIQLDPKFAAPFDMAIQLCRSCAHYRLGGFEDAEATLNKLVEIAPDDYRPHAALGEIYQAVGNGPRSADSYEKAIEIHLKLGEDASNEQMQERASLYSRLGMVQMNMNMPVNAERNLKKAIELESPERPSLEVLTAVLAQTNRQHEIPMLWKEEADRNPTSARVRARYATALVQSGRQDEGIQVFEQALEDLEDKTFVKRFYAPLLAERGELDRAMDFYEDCLDVAPNEIPVMLEYANTLKAADREFEIPPVLKNILASNPDPNTRANALAWLVELEQPKRAEAVEEARHRLESGDFDGVVRELKPLRNWLADYWKLWALLSAAYNRLNMSQEAEDAATRLLNLYPGYEPGYGELVNALSVMGKNEEAYNVMRHAVSNVGSLGVHVNLALAAKRAGHQDEARSLAKQIREAVGPNEELEPVLAEIES